MYISVRQTTAPFRLDIKRFNCDFLQPRWEVIQMPQVTYQENERLVYYVLKTYFPKLLFDEDAQQAGRMGLWEACLTKEKATKTFSPYAIKIIRNKITDYWRSLDKFSTPFSAFENSEAGLTDGNSIADEKQYVRDETEDYVIDFLMTLPARTQAMIRYRICGYTLQEIADKYNLTPQYVREIITKSQSEWREYAS